MTKSPEYKSPVQKKEILTPQVQPVTAKPIMAQPEVAKPVVSHFLAQPVMTPPQTVAPQVMAAKAPATPVLPKPVMAPKVAKVAKAAKAPKAAKFSRKAPVAKALKPVIETITEPVVEIPKLFEAQMKKLRQDWLFKDLDTGDIHIANAEISKLVETSNKATLDAISAMNKEIQSLCQHSVDDGFAMVKELMSAKSLPEAMAAQNKVALDAFNAALQCGLKLNAIASRTAFAAFRPLSDSLTQRSRGFF